MKHKFAYILSAVTLAVSMLLPSTAVHAATSVVTSNADSGEGSLRAILASAASGDTITFDPTLSGGAIYLAATLDVNINITIDASSLAAPITISGDTGNDGTGDVEVFYVDTGVTAAFKNIRIANGDAASGGGIQNSGVLTLDHVILDNNAADYGGAIDNFDGTLVITNSTFTNNYAFNYGGGIETNGSVTISNSTFSGNTTDGSGGALENFGTGSVTISNSTFYNNSAVEWGGAIENGETLTITNSTFSSNSAAANQGGAIDHYSGIMNYSNNIIANSSAGGDCVSDSTIGTNVNNLVEDGGCTSSLSGDPKLGALADNGGPTQTISLLADSTAIDAADDATCIAAPINNLDQRGIVRPQGVHCDLGSYERDSTMPAVVSITRNIVNPVNAASVSFTVTFSEPVSGVDLTAPFNDFFLTAAGVSGAAVSGVSGAGSVYTVTASTGSGAGTLRLDVLDNDSVMDLSTNRLGGSGTGNGDFVSGEIYKIRTVSFADVPLGYWSWQSIERLGSSGITGGCGNGNYCPNTAVTRAQMAIFLLRGIHGSAYIPPAATGTKFSDVAIGSFGAAFIEELAFEGITSGCGGGNYCPNQTVSRVQMAIFLVKAKHGSGFVPPAAVGLFADVPVSSFGANYIEQLVADGVTSGCGGGNYCPATMVKRDSMAVFLVKNFNLP